MLMMYRMRAADKWEELGDGEHECLERDSGYSRTHHELDNLIDKYRDEALGGNLKLSDDEQAMLSYLESCSTVIHNVFPPVHHIPYAARTQQSVRYCRRNLANMCYCLHRQF